MNKKGFVEGISEIKVMLLFVLVVIIFLALYLAARKQVESRIDAEFSANYQAMVINNVLYQEVSYNDKFVTVAELMSEHQKAGGQINWEYQPASAEVIRKAFQDAFKEVFDDGEKWRLEISFYSEDGKEKKLESIGHGTLINKKLSVQQAIPTYDRRNALIRLWQQK